MFKKILIGIFGGIITGLFASGGGMILVPAFIHLLNLEDRTSRATAIFCILPWVILSGLFYYKNNFIDWRIGILASIGGIIRWFFRCKIIKEIAYKISSDYFYCFYFLCSI